MVWDDFNRFLETTTGKETLYNTVSITHQIISTEESIDLEHLMIMKIFHLRKKHPQDSS